MFLAVIELDLIQSRQLENKNLLLWCSLYDLGQDSQDPPLFQASDWWLCLKSGWDGWVIPHASGFIY